MHLRRHNHLFKDDAIVHWKLCKNDLHELEFDVMNKDNHPGFVGFSMNMKDGKVTCNLVIDKENLDQLQTDLGQTLANNYNVIKSTNSFNSIKITDAFVACLVSTEDPRMIEVMVNVIDRRLKFTAEQYNLINTMIARNEVAPSSSCRIL